jgi:hypothetical protein
VPYGEGTLLPLRKAPDSPPNPVLIFVLGFLALFPCLRAALCRYQNNRRILRHTPELLTHYCLPCSPDAESKIHLQVIRTLTNLRMPIWCLCAGIPCVNGPPHGGRWRPLLCIVWRGSFLEPLGSILHGKRSSPAFIVRVISCSAEGLDLRGTARGWSRRAVRRFRVPAGPQPQAREAGANRMVVRCRGTGGTAQRPSGLREV